MDIQLKRGILEVCVLSALLSADSYGYQIIKDVSPYLTISESTLYPILRRLESAGCLTTYSMEHSSRLRKYYSITPQGVARIQEFLTEWKSVMELYSYIKGEYDREQA
ncbi:MAG: PadR family transcriptional regulator [Oscillospiraceae bacterium]|nr:PadR family transcriptional regulator [Oscillospiraceae bacterium]